MSNSRLQQPFGIAPDEASFISMHNLSYLLMFAIAFCIIMLVIMNIRLHKVRAFREHSVERESNEPMQFKCNSVSRGMNNSEEDIAKVTIRLRELVERAQRLLVAMQTFDRNNTAPLPKLENAQSPVQTGNYLSFFLGDELFAISTRNVVEVVEANKLIIESNRPLRIRRAISLRGSVVPVIDLSTYFGVEQTKVNQSAHILILILSRGERQQMIGIKVDALCKILSIALSSIEPSLVQQADIRSGFILGTLRADNRSITLLDISKGLSTGIFPKWNHAPAPGSR
ncbi:chemotaxis protein CheW [Pseudomonas lini]